MNTITVKNLSTFADYSAVARVARLMSGDEYYATHELGIEVVRITRSGNTYTVLNKDKEDCS